MRWRKGIIEEAMDIFFGSPGPNENPKIGNGGVTLAELIRRKKSIISIGKKYYRVTIEPVTLQVKEGGE